jgi:hypothetical protein
LIRWQELLEEEFAFEIVDEVSKHLSGQHDQSTHAGGKKIAGVPNHVDLEGKRMDVASMKEFRNRLIAFENAGSDTMDRVANEVYGTNWSNLKSYEADSLRYGDEKSQRKPLRQIIDEDPNVIAAKESLENHFLYKDAANQLAYNEDGSLGPTRIGDLSNRSEHGYFVDTPLERMKRALTVRAFDDAPDGPTAERFVHRRDENGRFLRDEDNGRIVTVYDVNVDKADYDLADAEWRQFGEEGEVTYIASNKALRSILASGQVKGYLEADRPARAGRTDEGYKNARLVYENNAFGYTTDDPASSRPISTFLTSTRQIQSELLSGYGGTQIVLKPSVKGRATATPDDSLNTWQRPKSYSEFFEKIPRSTGDTAASNYRLTRAASDIKVNGSGYFKKPSFTNYPEIQIHGGVTANDIARVVFQSTPPAAVSSKLTKLDIPFEVVTQEGFDD